MVTKMIDEESNWMPLHEVIARVAEIKQCYQENAARLVWEAVSRSEVKSRTVDGSPSWLASHLAGQEIFHSDGGVTIELWREDVFRKWKERSKQEPSLAQTPNSSRPRPREMGIVDAIRAIWPNGIPARQKPKERDNKIRAWLIERGENISDRMKISRQIQRVLRKHPELCGPSGNSEAVKEPDSWK
jgi:hypothetical protein